MAEVSSHDILEYMHINDSEQLADPGPCRIVICMSPVQSSRLRKAQYLQSDIAFKRVVGFKEFELGGLDRESKNCELYTVPSKKYKQVFNQQYQVLYFVEFS